MQSSKCVHVTHPKLSPTDILKWRGNRKTNSQILMDICNINNHCMKRGIYLQMPFLNKGKNENSYLIDLTDICTRKVHA